MSDHEAPLIVITVSDPARSTHPAVTAQKHALYAAAIARHGGKPVLLDPAASAAERDRLLAEMDGLLFSGGADIDPALYGEAPAGTTDVDHDRDALELAAWHEAERRSVPVLGICRGLQAINVFSGGKLLQDVPSHAGTPYGQGPAQLHPLEIDPATRLGRAVAAAAPDGVAGADPEDDALQLEVNTFHHQAVSEEGLAPRLRASAWAYADGVRLVEGIESTGGHWIMGVQCHPERTDSTPPELDGLWSDFVAVAGAARTTRGAGAEAAVEG
jgi:putative glutamine amidotransferase